MLCKNCGRSIEFNKKFCKCGEDPIGENKNDFEFIEKLLYTELDTIPNIPSPSKKRKGSLIAVILPICFVLVVVVVGAIAFPRLLTNLPTGKNISDSIQRGDEIEIIVKLPKGEKLRVYTKKNEKFQKDKQLKDGDKLTISKTSELNNDNKYFLIIDGEFKDKYIRKRDMKKLKKYLAEVSEATNKKTQTTSSTTMITTKQNTTIEIILNEPYYIKYNAEKEYVAMYREPNTDSEVITRFSPNGKKAIKVTLISKDDNSLWKVKYKGKTGYIHKDNLVRDEQKATTPTTTTTKIPETTAKNTRAYPTYTTSTNQNNYANNQNLKSKNQHNDKIDVKDGL